MRPIAVAALFLLVAQGPNPAKAQDAAMKTCGEKWQALKAAGGASGKTWPKYLAECRAELAAEKPATTPAKATETKATEAKASGRAPTGDLVFPSAIPEKYADLKPAQARRKTCADQYKANKEAKANGGLSWIEKGGGYWSLCNRKLKA